MSAGIDSTAMQRGLGGGETGIREYRDAASRVGQADGEAGRRAREGGTDAPEGRHSAAERDEAREQPEGCKENGVVAGHGKLSPNREGLAREDRQTERDKERGREAKREREREREKEGGRKGAVYWGKLFLSLFRQAVTPHCPTGKSKKSSRARRQGGCQPGRPINPLSQDRQHFFFLLNKFWSSDRAFGEVCQSA